MNNIFLKFSAVVASTVLAGATLVSCNKDNDIEASVERPVIILDNADGVYTVKTGHELTIAPEFKNVGPEGSITWTLDGNVVCSSTVWTSTWSTEGEYYVDITATNAAGSAKEEIRVDVLALTPPVISLRLPEGGLKVKASTDYTFTLYILHSDMEGFGIEWYVDGEEVCREETYTFNESAVGVYHMLVKAYNIDGSTEKEFDIEVVDNLPSEVSFAAPSYFSESTDRYTFAGRPVYLRPILTDIDEPTFRWEIDGRPSDCTERMLKFTPAAPGEYTVKVIVNDGPEATVKVVCVNATEDERMRPKSGTSSPFADKVYEWIPAPGQFINETSQIGGMTGGETTHASATKWAEGRLASNLLVSLGAFGGYITVGFDHSVALSALDYDFAVGGNAFRSETGNSNEPGIVWVMQDVNGNGLPDDEWYELRGCEFDNPSTIFDYSVTYFRPAGPRMNVEWEDSEGKSGTIRYLDRVHTQDYYYPAWIEADSYTLYGTRIPGNNSEDSATGYWNNAPYDWGYADNAGSDIMASGTTDGLGQRTGFKLANAVYADGTPVSLKYVDFVKVQTAVMSNSGPLGEVSTEVCGFVDCSMK